MKQRPDDDILRANLYEEQRAASQDYFGDTIRYLFIIIATIMLITLPYANRKVPFYFIISIVGVLLVGLCAGLTNARWQWTLLFDAIVAAGGMFFFEAYAVTIYRNHGSFFMLLLSQLLALLFFFAMYFSIQTFRRWLTYR
ncbi:MAG: hypothetical protein AAB420_01625 [Patescibacteria group bacterium]